jgi:hypothetical protein
MTQRRKIVFIFFFFAFGWWWCAAATFTLSERVSLGRVPPFAGKAWSLFITDGIFAITEGGPSQQKARPQNGTYAYRRMEMKNQRKKKGRGVPVTTHSEDFLPTGTCEVPISRESTREKQVLVWERLCH